MDLWWIRSCKHKISQSLNEARLEIVQHKFHKYYIDAFVDKNTENEWQLIGFYGKPDTVWWCEAWSKLKYLNSQLEIMWLCMGDFNEITKQD